MKQDTKNRSWTRRGRGVAGITMLGVAAALMWPAGSATAQGWEPTKPVQFVIPAGAGGDDELHGLGWLPALRRGRACRPHQGSGHAEHGDAGDAATAPRPAPVLRVLFHRFLLSFLVLVTLVTDV